MRIRYLTPHEKQKRGRVRGLKTRRERERRIALRIHCKEKKRGHQTQPQASSVPRHVTYACESIQTSRTLWNTFSSFSALSSPLLLNAGIVVLLRIYRLLPLHSYLRYLRPKKTGLANAARLSNPGDLRVELSFTDCQQHINRERSCDFPTISILLLSCV